MSHQAETHSLSSQANFLAIFGYTSRSPFAGRILSVAPVPLLLTALRILGSTAPELGHHTWDSVCVVEFANIRSHRCHDQGPVSDNKLSRVPKEDWGAKFKNFLISTERLTLRSTLD